MEMIKQSIAAGMLVGIGVIANVLVLNKYIGALLFSFALLSILRCELKLYTGKIGYYKQYKKSSLYIMLFFNIMGSLIPTISISLCRKDIYESFLHLSNIKFSNQIWMLFIYGFVCGILMLIAVHSNETIIIILCIMVFILSGYEHCIADAIYIAINFSVGNCVKFLFIVIGNTVGAILARYLIMG